MAEERESSSTRVESATIGGVAGRLWVSPALRPRLLALDHPGQSDKMRQRAEADLKTAASAFLSHRPRAWFAGGCRASRLRAKQHRHHRRPRQQLPQPKLKSAVFRALVAHRSVFSFSSERNVKGRCTLAEPQSPRRSSSEDETFTSPNTASSSSRCWPVAVWMMTARSFPAL